MTLNTRREEDILNLFEQLHRHVRPEGEAVYRKLERDFAEFTTEISTLKMAATDLGAIEHFHGAYMTRKEMALCLALERAGERGVTYDGLMSAAYGTGEDWPDPKIINVFIKHIRDKLPADIYIETCWARGYRMVKGEHKILRGRPRGRRKYDAHKYQTEAA